MEGGEEKKNMKKKWRKDFFYNLNLKSFQHLMSLFIKGF
jgi:hypothetical protein